MSSANPMLVHFLGTGSAAPTTKRFPTSQVLEFRQKNFLIDCGEGAQIQIRRNKLKFSRFTAIFISHLHGDHCFGLPGLISTFGMMGRTADLHIYAQKTLEVLMLPWFEYFMKKVTYKIVFHDIDPKVHQLIYEDRGVQVFTLPLKHSVPSCGFLFQEKRSMSKNRSYAYCSDTQYKESLIAQLQEVSLLYHEATFMQVDHKIAKETGHSTTLNAATIALNSHVKKLIIGHFSARYTSDLALLEEARSIFENTFVAIDGLTIEVE